MWSSTEVFEAEHDAIAVLAAAVEASDGLSPLNEAAVLAQSVPGAATHWYIEADGALAGYAQWHHADQTALVFVHPSRRRAGLGRELLDAVAAMTGEALAVWAFGDLTAAQALAASAGLRPSRGLHQMTRPLTELQVAEFAEGIAIRPYTPADLEIVHALNAAAFAHHPEQGRLTLDDLQARMDESWFDPADLILAFAGDQPLGFHWTKRESATEGEVYVLGVAPQAAGRGLGKALLWAGLNHLADVGCTEVGLFVDADNIPAVKLYVKAGFTIVRTDTLYRPAARKA